MNKSIIKKGISALLVLILALTQTCLYVLFIHNTKLLPKEKITE